MPMSNSEARKRRSGDPDGVTLTEAERDALLDPCACGHTLNDHGSLAGCWMCSDEGHDCAVTCEALIAERVARIVAARLRAVEADLAAERAKHEALRGRVAALVLLTPEGSDR